MCFQAGQQIPFASSIGWNNRMHLWSPQLAAPHAATPTCFQHAVLHAARTLPRLSACRKRSRWPRSAWGGHALAAPPARSVSAQMQHWCCSALHCTAGGISSSKQHMGARVLGSWPEQHWVTRCLDKRRFETHAHPASCGSVCAPAERGACGGHRADACSCGPRQP